MSTINKNKTKYKEITDIYDIYLITNPKDSVALIVPCSIDELSGQATVNLKQNCYLPPTKNIILTFKL